MTTPTLAIETGIEPEYEDALQVSADKAGWNVEVVHHIPFSDHFVLGDSMMGTPVPEALLKNPHVWFHGSIQAAKQAQKTTKWQVHAPWFNLRCQRYYPKLKERLLQKDHLFTTIAGVLERREELFASDLVEDGTLFFRPDGNDKTFTGGCISDDDFDHGYKLMTFYEPPPDTVVVVARPRNITAEARFLVVDGQIITGSFYKTGGQGLRLRASAKLMAVAVDMLEFCIAQGYNPDPSWVLDLAEASGGWHIIEVGGSSCCGLYKCDTDLFIQALGPLIRTP